MIKSIKNLYDKIFRWGPKNPISKILWVVGLLLTKPFKHGEGLARYKMYSDITEIVRRENINGKVLSISNSQELFKNFKKVEIFDANFPEYNWLDLPFPDESFDCVISDMVLEHVEGNPQKVFNESYRLLKKGGYLIVSSNFAYPLHMTPDDFWRFSKEGLKFLCRNFSEIIASGETGNLGIIFMIIIGLNNLPVPHSKYHPIHWLACRKASRWPVISWIIAKR